MITDADVEKLKKSFATKEDLADLKLEVGEVHDKVDLILEKMDHVVALYRTYEQKTQPVPLY